MSIPMFEFGYLPGLIIDVAITWTTPEAPAGSPGSVYNISSVRHRDPGTP